MEITTETSAVNDVKSWNNQILNMAMDNIEELEQRIELSLTSIFDPHDPDPCNQFGCTGYFLF